MVSNLGGVGTIFWGNAALCPISSKKPEFYSYAKKIVQDCNLQQIVYLQQKHLPTGLLIDQPLKKDSLAVRMFDYTGDYLITNQYNLGLAVLTADCLPIVFFDEKKKLVAIAHGGWKGSVAGIAKAVITNMVERFFSDPAELKIYFGPHARSCCYEVQPDFICNIPVVIQRYVFLERNGKIYFDLAAYNRIELLSVGIKQELIQDSFSCTICDSAYHSRRRDGSDYVGQSTVVWLKQ